MSMNELQGDYLAHDRLAEARANAARAALRVASRTERGGSLRGSLASFVEEIARALLRTAALVRGA